MAQNSTTVAGVNPVITNAVTTAANTPAPAADTELPSYQFVAGWIILFVILIFINQSRIGHVVIYYSLILMILLILVTEYTQIVPFLNSIQTIGAYDAANPKGA